MELQHFDLAGPVIPNVTYLENITPILMLWFTHDLPQVQTQGLVFETQVGRGRMLVRHCGTRRRRRRPVPGWHTCLPIIWRRARCRARLFEPRTIAALKNQLATQPIDLTDLP